MSPPKSWLYKTLWGATERLLIRRADEVMTVNQQRAEEFARRYAIETPVVVLNGPSECIEKPAAVEVPVRLIYQGGLSTTRGLDILISAMRAVQGRAVLSLQGFGVDRPYLEELIVDYGLGDSVRFIEPVHPSRVVSAAHEHDVGVVIYSAKTLNDRLAAPNKLLDYLGAGIAVLGVRLPMIEDIVTRERCGVLFEPEDEGDLRCALQRMVSDLDALLRMKEKAAQACHAYSWESQEQTLLELVGLKDVEIGDDAR